MSLKNIKPIVLLSCELSLWWMEVSAGWVCMRWPNYYWDRIHCPMTNWSPLTKVFLVRFFSRKLLLLRVCPAFLGWTLCSVVQSQLEVWIVFVVRDSSITRLSESTCVTVQWRAPRPLSARHCWTRTIRQVTANNSLLGEVLEVTPFNANGHARSVDATRRLG